MPDWRDYSLGDIHRLLAALEQHGGGTFIQGLIDRAPLPADLANARVTIRSIQNLLQQTNGSTSIPDEVVEQLNAVELPPPPLFTSAIRAREIMGRNFFGVEEAQQHFGVEPGHGQLMFVPFSEATLEACKDTHILVAVFPLSILDIRAKAHRDPKPFYSYKDAWYNTEAFASEKVEIGWHLVRKTPLYDSTSKSWDEQQALLSADEETPTAQVMVYTIIGHFLATGDKLFGDVYVCTSSYAGLLGGHVSVGRFDAYGLSLNHSYEGGSFRNLAIASARKS